MNLLTLLRRIPIQAAWIAAAAAVLAYGPGCGIHVPQLDCRVLGCPSGSHCVMDDTKVEATYHCVPYDCGEAPGAPVCSEATQRDCWECRASGWYWRDCRDVACPEGQTCEVGHAEIWSCVAYGPRCPTPPAEAPACPRGQQPGDPSWACGQDTGWQWAPICVEEPHGEVCTPGETCDCWVLPPTEDHWRELSCPAREGFTSTCPDRICVYSPVVPPPPPPGPSGSCGLREETLVATTCGSEQFAAENRRGTAALGPNPGGSPAANLEALAAWFRSQGWCAIAGSEAIFVLRDDGKVEERHSVYFGDGSWMNSGAGKFIGCHAAPEGSIKAEACPPPLPSRAAGKLKVKAEQHGRWVDSTLVTVMTCDYCRAIGMGESSPGVQRCGCPMRNEGDPYRASCEAYASGGTVWDVDPVGSTVELNGGNPWQARTNGERLRVCVADRSACSAWVDQP